MLKYKSIIEKLTVRQKIALITDLSALSDAAINRAGVPAVRQGNLAEFAAEHNGLLPFETVINSWDISLMEEMAEEIAAEARGREYKLLTTPDLKTVLNAYQDGLSEDPYLNGRIGAAMLRAIHRSGAAGVLADFSVDEKDVDFLDLFEDARAIFELAEKPFLYAVEETPCYGVCSSLEYVKGGYQSTNAKLFGEAVNGALGENIFVYSAPSLHLPNFHAFLNGSVCVGGGEVIVDRALGRYEQLKTYCETGSATELELKSAIEAGLAISSKTLDHAVDRVIDFAFRVNQIPPSLQRKQENLALRLAQESIVLIKNEGAVPLADQTKVAVIGEDGGFAESSSFFKVVGRALGTASGAAQSFAAAEAVRACKEAKVILLFLQTGSTPNSLQLSPTTLSLIEELSRARKQMVAVLTGNIPVDMKFDRYFSAVLIVPQGNPFCAAALDEVLAGKYNPSGKLARSYMDDADEYYAMLKNDKDQGKTKVGSFIGYRYYDTIGKRVRYPFGHGLSYTSFAYSALKVEQDEVLFTIKNRGARSGCEIAQIYIGFPKCSRISPKKELKQFIRVELAAGESKRVRVPLPRSSFASYDEMLGESVEKGIYRIYVGASVRDIRLKGTLFVDGEVRARREEKPQDYFRDISNIGKDYRMRTAEGRSSLPTKKKWISNLSLFVLFLTLLIAAIMGINLLRSGDTRVGIWVFLLADLGVAIFAWGILLYEKHYRRIQLRREIAVQRLKFPGANTVTSPNDLFNAAFKQTEAGPSLEGVPDEEHYFDKTLTFQQMCRDLQIFSAERGLLLGEMQLRTLIGAFTASHILVLSGNEKSINQFSKILSEYFGCKLYAENAENFSKIYEMFESWNAYGRQDTALTKAIKTAQSETTRMQICLIRHIKPDFLQIFSEPNIAKIPNELQDLPSNLILVMEVEQTLNLLPIQLTERAAVVSFEAKENGISTEKTMVRPMGRYQFEHLCRAVRDEYSLDERLWKRVDRLEKACTGESGYRISNRLWIKMEKHSSVYLACGGDASDALDSAVASELLPAVVERMRGSRTDEEILALLAEIFGVEQINECRAFFSART